MGVRPRTNLGWANSDPNLHPRFQECKDSGHDTNERNRDSTHHGYDTVCWCNTCGYEFHNERGRDDEEGQEEEHPVDDFTMDAEWAANIVYGPRHKENQNDH